MNKRGWDFNIRSLTEAWFVKLVEIVLFIVTNFSTPQYPETLHDWLLWTVCKVIHGNCENRENSASTWWSWKCHNNRFHNEEDEAPKTTISKEALVRILTAMAALHYLQYFFMELHSIKKKKNTLTSVSLQQQSKVTVPTTALTQLRTANSSDCTTNFIRLAAKYYNMKMCICEAPAESVQELCSTYVQPLTKNRWWQGDLETS